MSDCQQNLITIFYTQNLPNDFIYFVNKLSSDFSFGIHCHEAGDHFVSLPGYSKKLIFLYGDNESSLKRLQTELTTCNNQKKELKEANVKCILVAHSEFKNWQNNLQADDWIDLGLMTREKNDDSLMKEMSRVIGKEFEKKQMGKTECPVGEGEKYGQKYGAGKS